MPAAYGWGDLTNFMAINFSDKILVTNPTCYRLGRNVACLGIIVIGLGVVTSYTGAIMLPPMAWCAFGVPTTGIGAIFVGCGLTKRGSTSSRRIHEVHAR